MIEPAPRTGDTRTVVGTQSTVVGTVVGSAIGTVVGTQSTIVCGDPSSAVGTVVCTVVGTGSTPVGAGGPAGEELGPSADRGVDRPTATVSALGELVVSLDRACDELFAAVPFLGDQATGASVNAGVDDMVGALRRLRADADDLRRVMAIAQSRGGI